MITIQVSELKKFMSNAHSIKTKTTIPVLEYIRLQCDKEKSTLTKTNLEHFVVTEIEADFDEPQTILIQEKTLNGIVSTAKNDELKISLSEDGKYVILDDGIPTKSQTTNVDLFPQIEFPEPSEATEFNSDVLSALSIAKNHTSPMGDGMIFWLNLVYISKIHDKPYVFGSNGAVGYFREFSNGLPQVHLLPDAVSVISKYPLIHHLSNDNYDFFQSVGVTYGFAKLDQKNPELTAMFDQLNSEKSFVVNRSDVIRICERVIAINNSSLVAVVSFEDAGKEAIKLKFADYADNNSCSEKLKVENKTFSLDRFSILPRNMLTALKGITSEKIKMSKVQNNTIITSEDELGYIGFVAETQNV